NDTIVICQQVTWADLVGFRPATPTWEMEPAHWMVVGLPTNFYSTAHQQIVPGVLLGFDARVRFTPVRYRWSYGDGAAATASTAGGSWSTGDGGEFSATPTSHVYRT
ncbi:hypothetical protein ACC691_37700, partial [Rhizobium johnstonii]|uniref:hypothetical protein n=1 Tax=Rhizobium johnstonii TaxID=3019933 RepID=UPI003F99292A